MDIRNHAIESLEQLASAISPLSLSEYSQSLPTLHENSIGKHVRHVVEFFECLSKSQQHSVVNYDNRKRDLRLENNIDFTISRILELQSEIAVYQDRILSLEVDYGSGSQTISTTLFRELVYNIEHCVHHLAIIKIGVKIHFPSVHLSENLGVAYSTQQYQNQS
jgi:hypothetical protein